MVGSTSTEEVTLSTWVASRSDDQMKKSVCWSMFMLSTPLMSMFRASSIM